MTCLAPLSPCRGYRYCMTEWLLPHIGMPRRSGSETRDRNEHPDARDCIVTKATMREQLLWNSTWLCCTCDVPRNATTRRALECYVRSWRWRDMSRETLDISRTRRAAQRFPAAITRNKVERLSRIVRRRTGLSHATSWSPSLVENERGAQLGR